MTTHLARVVATAVVMLYSQGGLAAYIAMSIQHPNIYHFTTACSLGLNIVASTQ